MLPYPEFQKQFYDQLLLSQYDPPEKRQQDQRRNLERLIRFARRYVPFYKDRLDVLFTARDKIDWDKWKDVPVTRRQDIVDSGHLMVPEQLPPTHGRILEAQTSGSTGVPITVRYTQYASLLNMAAVYRNYDWFRLDNTKDIVQWVNNDPELGIMGNAKITSGWGAPWSNPQPEGRTVRYSRELSYEDMLTHLMQTAPVYLQARSTPTQTVALEALRRGVRVPLLGVLTYSTAATPAEVEDIREAFGCETIVPYSSKEAMMMAFRCPTGTHLHVNEETTMLEVLDDDAMPVGEGVMGRVYVTPIFNFAMPLIRYDHGDMAVKGGTCTCGRTLVRLDSIAGRAHHLFRFPSGRRVAPSISLHYQRDFGAAYWQVAQIGPLHLEVRYVMPPGIAPGPTEPIVQAFRAITDPDVVVTFQQKADLDRSASGKFMEYVCELAAD